MKIPAILVRIGPDLPSPEAASCSRRVRPPQVTFRAGVDLVDVEVSVLDKNRLPVRGLTASDFTVLEEGSPRPVVAFTAVDLPPRIMPPAPWMEQIAADTHTNQLRARGPSDRDPDGSDHRARTRYPEARRIAEAGRQPVARRRHGRCRVVAPRRAAELHGRSATTPGGHPRAGRQYARGRHARAANAIAAAARWTRSRRSPKPSRTSTGAGSCCCSSAAGFPGRGGTACAPINEPARKRALRAAEAGNLTIHVIDPGGIRTLSSEASSRTVRAAIAGAEITANGQPAHVHRSDRRPASSIATRRRT